MLQHDSCLGLGQRLETHFIAGMLETTQKTKHMGH